LFAPASALPPTIAAALPPAQEEAHVHATTFARYGSRAEGSAVRSVPVRDGSDPRLAGDLTPMRLSDGRLALVQPLLDGEDRIAGVLLAIGGATRETYWQPLAAPGPRWPAALDRLRGASRQVPADRLPVVRGPVRAAPFDGTVVLFQSAYTWREGRPPTLARIALWSRDTLRSGTSLAAALGSVSSDTSSLVTSDARRRARALELYESMRAALRRGDLSGFGAAFDSLGRVLGRPVP
jgi:hypothetical protein